MIVVDIGNTNTVIGIFHKRTLKNSYRLETKSLTILKYLKKNFSKNKIKNIKLDYNICIISSVVPKIDNKIFNFFKSINIKTTFVSYSNTKKIFNCNIKNHNQLGSDRIANSLAAINKYGKNCLVLDFGTATTFDVIKNEIYEGGIIAPGINVSLESLINKTSKLRKIKISKINKVVGKNTFEAMQSGFYWGYESLISGIIRKILKDKKYKPILIMTGGLSYLFKNKVKIKTVYEPYLTLYGLYIIGLNNNA